MIGPRPLPGLPSVCRECGAKVRWATTVFGPHGPGGEYLALDHLESEDGDVAAHGTRAGALLCRVLGKDDELAAGEYRAMRHAESCTLRPEDAIAEVVEGLEDLSHAGKRAGMTEGTRSNLWVMMREAIAALRPSLVVWENVAGAYSAEADSELVRDPRLLADLRRRPGQPLLRALGRVLGDLDSLGYVGGWHGLRASDIGAPHGRLRVFVVAVPADASGHAWGLVDRNRRPAADSSSSRGGALGSYDVEARSAAGPHRNRERALPTPTSRDWKGHNQRGDDSCLAGALLPTPNTQDGEHSIRDAGDRGDRHQVQLAHALGSLLPTPRATDGTKGGPNQRGSSGDLMLPSAVAQLLPTPVASDASDSARHTTTTGVAHSGTSLTDALRLLPTPNPFHAGNTETPDEWRNRRADVFARTGTRHGPALSVVALSVDEGNPLVPDNYMPDPGEDPDPDVESRLLPTPTSGAGGQTSRSGDRIGEPLIGGIVRDNLWGEYAPAIARWETLTRPAPEPTERDWDRWEKRRQRRLQSRLPVGMRGSVDFIWQGPKPRLAAVLPEWMMGLPAGWITDVPGITRNEALKACGNGVVPQQAAAALWFLLAVLEGLREAA